MAKGRNGPSIEELFGKDDVSADTDEAPASPAEPRTEPVLEAVSLSPPLHLLHETRLVRNAGRMVAGTTVAVPQHLLEGPGAAFVEATTPIITAERPAKRGVPRAAVVVACAVAIGSAASLTGIIDPHPAAGVAPRGGGGAGIDITGALPQAQPFQAFAISAAPIIGIAQFADQIPSGLIRVAQKDASGLEVENIFGPAGKPIRVPVSLNGSRAEEYSFLMFRGLPPKVTLSAGFRLKESWAVSLRDLDNLTLETPNGFQASFNLEVLLIKGRDTPAESKVISVEIVPQDLQLPSTSALGQPGPQVLTAAPRTPDAERPAATTKRGQVRRALIPASEEQSMMQRADALLQNNDVSSARLLYEHLAKNGSAKAALAMGKTYDPAFFRNIEATGLKPDVGKAREWYGQAADLGDQEATNRLNALASR